MIRSLTRAIVGTLVFMAAFTVCWPALSADWVDWDDNHNFLNNMAYRGLGPGNLRWMFSTFHMGHYQPLTWMSLGLDYQISRAFLPPHPRYGPGMNPLPYHLTNQLLHGLNALLVFWIGFHLLGAVGGARRPGPRGRLVAAALAALLFALHPLRVESVAWITQRRDLLSAGGYLLCIAAYLQAQHASGLRRRLWLAGSLTAFVLCNLSKMIGVTLPVVLLILDWYPLRRIGGAAGWTSPAARRAVGEKLPLLALALAAGLVGTLGQARHGWLIGLDELPIAQRLVLMCFGLTFYLYKTVVPLNLGPIYELHTPLRLADPRFLAPLLIVPAASLLLARLRHRAPGLVAATLAYAVVVLPVSGLLQNGWQLAHDRYSYLACIGPGLALTTGCVLAFSTPRATRMRPAGLCTAGLVLLTLGAMSWRQSYIWRDSQSLWTHALTVSPDSSYAHNGLAYVLLQRGEQDEAQEQPGAARLWYEQALRHAQAAVDIHFENEDAQANLWYILRKLGRTDQRMQALEAARRARMPLIAARASNLLGNVHFEHQDWETAARYYQEATRKRPDMAEAYVNLGQVRARQGRFADAVDQFRIALRLRPRYKLARLYLASALERMGRLPEAEQELVGLLRLDPDWIEARSLLEQIQAARRHERSGRP